MECWGSNLGQPPARQNCPPGLLLWPLFPVLLMNHESVAGSAIFLTLKFVSLQTEKPPFFSPWFPGSALAEEPTSLQPPGPDGAGPACLLSKGPRPASEPSAITHTSTSFLPPVQCHGHPAGLRLLLAPHSVPARLPPLSSAMTHPRDSAGRRQ